MGRAVGSYAQSVVAHQRSLMRMPSSMSWPEAAAVPNVFVTAHDALVTNAAVRHGESVMVTAGPRASARPRSRSRVHIGANPVIATTRTPAKADALRALGAHEVVDTRDTAKWVDAVMRATAGRGVDVIIDHVGGPMLAANISVLALKSRLVSVGRNAGRVGDCDLDEIARKRASIIGVTFRTRTPEESLACSERLRRAPDGRGHEGRTQARARPHVPVRASPRRTQVHAERRADRKDRADDRPEMSFKIILLGPGRRRVLARPDPAAVPGIAVTAFRDAKDALAEIEDADAAYGTVPPELLARAKKLRWICASRAGLGGDWFYDALVKSDVVVTNMRGSYNEHLSAHAVAFLLAFARRFEHYLPQKQWKKGPGMIDLPTKTVLIVGVGGAGAEAAKLCAALGMKVLGADPRVTTTPPGVSELFTPERLADRLGEADFVIVTTPETP
jgi:D-arabinose 1-dehydrogenase-like Zn-dependent alcohol dehydrogenase